MANNFRGYFFAAHCRRFVASLSGSRRPGQQRKRKRRRRRPFVYQWCVEPATSSLADRQGRPRCRTSAAILECQYMCNVHVVCISCTVSSPQPFLPPSLPLSLLPSLLFSLSTFNSSIQLRSQHSSFIDYSYSYRVTLFNELFSEESCSVIGLSEKMGLQLLSELSATVERWAEVRWKCVPDDRSRDGETSLADGRVFPRNEHVTAVSRTEWPTWQIRDWADDYNIKDR